MTEGGHEHLRFLEEFLHFRHVRLRYVRFRGDVSAHYDVPVRSLYYILHPVIEVLEVGLVQVVVLAGEHNGLLSESLLLQVLDKPAVDVLGSSMSAWLLLYVYPAIQAARPWNSRFSFRWQT